LGAALFFQGKVVFGQVFYDLSRLVPNGGKEIDQLDVRRVLRRLLAGRALLAGEQARDRKQRQGGEQASPGEFIFEGHSGKKMCGSGFVLPEKSGKGFALEILPDLESRSERSELEALRRIGGRPLEKTMT
jgi:hypothetical protein